jgi:hypothetical protein
LFVDARTIVAEALKTPISLSPDNFLRHRLVVASLRWACSKRRLRWLALAIEFVQPTGQRDDVD